MIGSRGSEHDVVVIGAGAGGLTVAIGLAGFGRRVALVEAGPVGGDCTNVGCIPSKRLIHLTRSRGSRERSAAILDDVRATRDALARRERSELLESRFIELIEGRATFTSPRTVRVAGTGGERMLRASHVVVATGSRPRHVEIPGLPARRLLTNETLFDLATAPAHLAIVGAGAVGLEMAGAFNRMGSQVTLIDVADRVLSPAIPAASGAIEATLRHAGVGVRLGTRAERYDETDLALTIRRAGRSERVEGVDAVLVAAGREPSLAGLRVDAAGVAAGGDGIAVDSWGRTSTRGVWAVGDVTAGSHQTHAANALGRRIVQRIALPWLPPLGRAPVIPSAVFCEPEVAWIGPQPAELARLCDPRVVTHIRVDLADTDRGLTDGVTHGFVAIDTVRLTGRIVAATVVGPNASELIAVIGLAMARRITLLRLARHVYAYPTFAGAIGQVADQFARATAMNLRREIATYTRHRFRGGDRRQPG